MTRRGVLRAWTLGGLALAMAASLPASARAQVVVGVGSGVGYGGYGGYGYNGYGLGAYGGGYGYSGGYGYGGPFGGMGTTLYDQEMYKQQQYALASSRYDLQTAQAAQAYSQANYYKQQSITAALANQKQATALRESYSTKTTAPKFRTAPAASRPTVPLTRLISPVNGAVQWPAVAPENPARANAAARVAEVSSQYRKEGQATVQSVGEARDAIYAYGRPALEAVRKTHPSQASTLKDFLNNLDLGLDVMAQPPAPVKVKK